MTKYRLSISAAALLMLSACNDRAKVVYGEYEAVDSAQLAAADSLANLGDPKIDENDRLADEDVEQVGIPRRRFQTKQQALEFMRESGHWSEYSTGIILPMLDDNFVYADRLLNNKYDYFIVADKQSMHVALFDRYGNLVKSYPMAAARNFGTKHRRGDCRTPEGFFYAQGIYDSTDWLYTDDNGHTSPTKGVYGPRFIRVKADVTSAVGIHGTGSPGSVGRRVSHGCMRLSNESILDLVKYAKTGMPIIVNPSDRDQAVNRSEGYTIGQIDIGLAASASGRDFSSKVSGNYLAAPEKVDSAHMMRRHTTGADSAAVNAAPVDTAVSHPAEHHSSEPAKADTVAVAK